MVIFMVTDLLTYIQQQQQHEKESFAPAQHGVGRGSWYAGFGLLETTTTSRGQQRRWFRIAVVGEQ